MRNTVLVRCEVPLIYHALNNYNYLFADSLQLRSAYNFDFDELTNSKRRIKNAMRRRQGSPTRNAYRKKKFENELAYYKIY
jgi:hypothetical protein